MSARAPGLPLCRARRPARPAGPLVLRRQSCPARERCLPTAAAAQRAHALTAPCCTHRACLPAVTQLLPAGLTCFAHTEFICIAHREVLSVLPVGDRVARPCPRRAGTRSARPTGARTSSGSPTGAGPAAAPPVPRARARRAAQAQGSRQARPAAPRPRGGLSSVTLCNENCIPRISGRQLRRAAAC